MIEPDFVLSRSEVDGPSWGEVIQKIESCQQLGRSNGRRNVSAKRLASVSLGKCHSLKKIAPHSMAQLTSAKRLSGLLNSHLWSNFLCLAPILQIPLPNFIFLMRLLAGQLQ